MSLFFGDKSFHTLCSPFGKASQSVTHLLYAVEQKTCVWRAIFPAHLCRKTRGFTRGFVAIEKFLILMIYSKKIGIKRLTVS